ncbi:MAG: hypothetical protein SGJ04_01405 [Bacteroidota bacterium]|nr:hypothetical protein [Bacteroidota bacterium]
MENTSNNLGNNLPLSDGTVIKLLLPRQKITDLTELRLRIKHADKIRKESAASITSHWDYIDNKYFGNKFHPDGGNSNTDFTQNPRRAALIASPLRLIAAGILNSVLPTPLAAGGSGLILSALKIAGSYYARRFMKNKIDGIINSITGSKGEVDSVRETKIAIRTAGERVNDLRLNIKSLFNRRKK